MKLRRVVALAALVVSCAVPSTLPAASVKPLAGVRNWVVYYGAEAETGRPLSRFDLVVLDPNRHPPLEDVKRHGSLLLMYVSLGELNVNHPRFAALAQEPWLLAPSPTWPDARRLDVRASGYRDWLLTKIAPAALRPGVHGLFLDTGDSSLALEREDPARFGGMRAALVETVRAIRGAYPNAVLVLNGALPVADQLSAELDGVVVESIWTDYDFAGKQYRRRPLPEAQERMAGLKDLGARGLTVLTLEYAPPDDHEWIERLRELSAAQRFVPYISTIGLDRVFTRTLN